LSGQSNFCGTWCPRMFFVWRNGESMASYLNGFIRSYMGVILVFGVLGTTFFLGRYWCSHICPVGGSMELVSKLVPKFMKINFSKIPAPAFRYGYLTVFFLAAATGIGSLCCNYCNFATIPRLFGAAFSQAELSYFLRTSGLINLGLVVILGFFAKGGRAYCNLICPIGALDSLSNRLGLRAGRRMNIDESKCNGCGKCEDSCPVWAIEVDEKARIDSYSCMPCGECQTSCNRGAISYGKIERQPMLIQGEAAIEKN
jgi:ferredoxin-type protein NapH